jgi:nucleoside-diphosphate-sugar epimerase
MTRRLLLTGATGAVGPPVVAELLRSSRFDAIDLLIRPAPAGALQSRFDTLLQLVRDELADAGDALPDTALARLHLLPGDLSADNLGIDDASEKRLRASHLSILHLAADTHFRSPPEHQTDINYRGTARLLDFAARCPRLRRLLFVSTICVTGTGTGVIPEASIERPPAFINHYELTKWQAERLVLQSSLPVQIARLSIVMGSHRTGRVYRPGALHRVLKWVAMGRLPLIPAAPGAMLDLIPAEAVAGVLARAIDAEAIAHPIFHIAAGHGAAPVDAMLRFVLAHAGPAGARPPARLASPDEFERWCDTRAARPAAAEMIASLHTFIPNLLYPKRFETAAAEALWGGPLPVPPWQQTLSRVLPACIRRRPGLARVV